MLSPLEIGAASTAGFGALTMLWGNIKGVFARLESLIIVKAQLSGYVSDHVMDYCWANFKSSPLGIRRFCAQDRFIRPKNRFGRVASETTGKFVTFWNGHKPLFVSTLSDNTKNDSGEKVISFIRGTFDLEKLIIDATNFYDSYHHEKTHRSSRYYVRRCFGTKKNRNGDEPDQPPLGSAKTGDKRSDEDTGFRPLFYSKEDLGVPTSQKPMDNLAYEEEVLEFYQETVRWKESKEWFESKGLPWRFGAGLFGPPGSGKTSLARAIGQSLDLPIHSYDLTTMDNQDLTATWQTSLGESPCIVLLEDLDRIFDSNKEIKTSKDKSPLTLDCLLNCISGVQPSEGILVLVTANDTSKFPDALGVRDSNGKLTRPGRLDREVYVGILDEEGRYKIAKRILSDCLDLVDKTVSEGDGETGAQFESRCSKLALDQYWGRLKICEIEKEVEEKVEERLYN
jgi:hypothetical protein